MQIDLKQDVVHSSSHFRGGASEDTHCLSACGVDVTFAYLFTVHSVQTLSQDSLRILSFSDIASHSLSV